jgi:transposase
LPRTRAEDAAFRESLSRGEVTWRPIHDKTDDKGVLLDRYSLCAPATVSAEGYRLVWYHSTRKAELDALTRQQQVARTQARLSELRLRLLSPRTRYRQRAKVEAAVAEILEAHGAARWITVAIEERPTETYHQQGRGRPSEQTLYTRQVSTRFELTYRIEQELLAAEAQGDGFFPLITNETSLSERDLLLAYKGQAAIERRFAQLKTDFEVAPVYLNQVSRIAALLCVYFFVLLVEALLERELRRAMKGADLKSLPMYPEGRACERPTARRVIDLFEEVQRHELVEGDHTRVVFTTELTRLQRQVLQLLRMSAAYDG